MADRFSKLQSALLGAQQGATLGFADEMAGGTQAALDKLAQLTGQSSPTDVSAKLAAQGFTGDIGPTSTEDLYSQARDVSRKDFSQAQAENPKSYLAGELAAAAATSALPVGSAARASDLASAIRTGGIVGGVAGAGASEKQGLGLAKDVAMGAGIGAVGGGVLKSGVDKFGKLTGLLGKNMSPEELALYRAARAEAPETLAMRRLPKDSPFNPDYLAQKKAIEARATIRRGDKAIKKSEQEAEEAFAKSYDENAPRPWEDVNKEIDAFAQAREEMLPKKASNVLSEAERRKKVKRVYKEIEEASQKKKEEDLGKFKKIKEQMNIENPEEITQIVPEDAINKKALSKLEKEFGTREEMDAKFRALLGEKKASDISEFTQTPTSDINESAFLKDLASKFGSPEEIAAKLDALRAERASLRSQRSPETLAAFDEHMKNNPIDTSDAENQIMGLLQKHKRTFN